MSLPDVPDSLTQSTGRKLRVAFMGWWLLVTLSVLTGTAASAQELDWASVESAMGRPAVVQNPNVRRFSFPRSDLRVTVGPVTVRPGLALGGWVAFAPHEGQTVMMGDLVLTAEELGPVVEELQRRGIKQTAIHHHLVGESPRILYVHVHGHGDPVRLAQGIRAAVARTSIPPPAPPPTAPPPMTLDTNAVAGILGVPGRSAGGVYQVGVPRRETIRQGDIEIPSALGLGTVINFQPTEAGRAAITGDFVLVENEVNPVIATLAQHGIQATSLHNHLLDETPRLFFLHFWAHAEALSLARGLRAALDLTNSARPAR